MALAQRQLTAALGSDGFARRAVEIGQALWTGDVGALEALGGRGGVAQDAAKAVSEGEAERRRLGHYLGAMLAYDGQWFWGDDRLWHPEAKLAAEGRGLHRQARRRWRPIATCGSARRRSVLTGRRSRCGSRSAVRIPGWRSPGCAGWRAATAPT